MFTGHDRDSFSDDDEAASSRLAWIRRRLHALGRVPDAGSGLTVQRFQTLADIARLDGALARLAEGHLDALAIRDELGAGPDPAEDEIWGVWAAQPQLLAAEQRGADWRLCGEKPWCSGADGIDRALVTATDPGGRVRLFDVAVDEVKFADDWRAIGMRASDSRTGRFDVAVPSSAQVGPLDGYVERAGFWHGGVGVAACWHGLAQRLAADLCVHARRDDPFVRAAAGRAAGLVAASSTLLAAAGRQIDDHPGDVLRAQRRARLVRVAVAGSSQAVLDESIAAQGAGALCFDPVHARAVADLTVYVRQLHHGRDAAAVEIGADDDWWSS